MKRFATAVVMCAVLIWGLRALGLAKKPTPPPPPLFSFSADDGKGGGVKIRVGSDGKVTINAEDGEGAGVHLSARKRTSDKPATLEVSAHEEDDDDDAADEDDDSED